MSEPVSIHSRLLGREIPTRNTRGRSKCSFNPLPAFRPGDTGGATISRTFVVVSIHSRLLGREIHTYQVILSRNALFQSTPGF